MYNCFWASFLELLYHAICHQLISVKPLVVRVGISDPLDQVLHLAIMPSYPQIEDLLHFIFFFIIDKVWGWLCVIGAMKHHFLIRGPKIHMKHGVNLPLFW